MATDCVGLDTHPPPWILWLVPPSHSQPGEVIYTRLHTGKVCGIIMGNDRAQNASQFELTMIVYTHVYMPSEGHISANQNDRKSVVWQWTFEGRRSILDWYFDKY